MDEDTFIVESNLLSHCWEDERKLQKYVLILLLCLVYLTFEMNTIYFQGILAKLTRTPSCCILHF